MIGCYLPAGRYRLSRFPGEFALHRSGQRGSEVKRKGGGKRGNPEGYHSCRQALGYIGAGSHRKGRGPKSSQSRGKQMKTLLRLGVSNRVDPRTVPRGNIKVSCIV